LTSAKSELSEHFSGELIDSIDSGSPEIRQKELLNCELAGLQGMFQKIALSPIKAIPQLLSVPHFETCLKSADLSSD
jgi:hypothetical protein